MEDKTEIYSTVQYGEIHFVASLPTTLHPALFIFFPSFLILLGLFYDRVRLDRTIGKEARLLGDGLHCQPYLFLPPHHLLSPCSTYLFLDTTISFDFFFIVFTLFPASVFSFCFSFHVLSSFFACPERWGAFQRERRLKKKKTERKVSKKKVCQTLLDTLLHRLS